MLNGGATTLDITPPLGTLIPGLFHERRAEGVHDPLNVRSFVLERDGGGIAIVVCDLVGVSRTYLDRAKARIAESTGLAPERVLICCTHTHSGAQTGDDAYTAFLVERIADSVRMAWDGRDAAAVGWGCAQEGRPVFNRRFHMADGTVRTNPGIGNPDVVKAAGPVDPDVGVICIQKPDGEPVGLLCNYALHYVGGGDHEREISADYFGHFSRLIQRMRGKRFTAALSNGASGDINNHDVIGGSRSANDRHQHSERVAALLAAQALWVWNEMEFTGDLLPGGEMVEVALQRKARPSPADIARAREIDESGRGTMADRAFARRILRRMADVPDETRTWVQALRIGDLALVGVPGELLVRPGLEIKKRSPFGQTIVLELANDSVGYLPDEQACKEGGYEPEAALYSPGSGEKIVEAAVGLLDRLHCS
ncbi:MAG: hypothetical protein J4F39_02845 [Candidatus Latescibacteria bacterium]|nr:hypothetical protein [Candidatus Latescibacterota bacterium]